MNVSLSIPCTSQCHILFIFVRRPKPSVQSGCFNINPPLDGTINEENKVLTFTWSPHWGVWFRKKLFLCILINKRLKNDHTRFKMSCILTPCWCVSICITEQAIFIMVCWLKSFLFFTANALVSSTSFTFRGVFSTCCFVVRDFYERGVIGVWDFWPQNPHWCFCCRKRCLSQTDRWNWAFQSSEQWEQLKCAFANTRVRCCFR